MNFCKLQVCIQVVHSIFFDRGLQACSYMHTRIYWPETVAHEKTRFKFEGRTWCFNCNLTGINCQNNYCIYFVVRRNHVHLINIFSSDMDNRNILVYSRPHGKDVDRVMFRFHADMKWKCEIVAKILIFVFVLGNKTKCHLKGKWLPLPFQKK